MKTTARFTSLLLALLFCLSMLSASALAEEKGGAAVIDSGTCGDNLTWTITDDGTLTIKGTGKMDDYEYYKNPAAYPVGETEHPVPWASHYVLMPYGSNTFPGYYCTEIKKVVVKNGVTRIGSHAFCNMIDLESVSLPKSLTEIGNQAFFRNAFAEISLPDGLRVIEELAFGWCENLKQIEIPSGVTELGEEALRHCTSMESVVLNPGIQTIDSFVFMGCSALNSVAIPSTVTSIGEAVFSYCIDLNSVTLPAGLQSLGKRAFEDCRSLEELTIPDGISVIRDRTFLRCYALTHVEIPASVNKIEKDAFNSCKALQEVDIPAGVTAINKQTFYRCYSLKRITLPAGVTKIDNNAFRSCTALEEIEIPDGVTTIGSGAFYYCRSLKQIVLPASVTTIGSFAFRSCKTLEELVIPDGVTAINAQTFYNCSSLNRLVIPASVKKILEGNSYGCKALTQVDYLGTPEQWNAIKLSTKQNYYLLRAASYNLPLCKITTKYANYSYTGSKVMPTVTVKTLNDAKLKKDTNYTVSYDNNKEYGTASITVTGIGKYSGTAVLTFRIVPAKVQDLTMEREETYADLTWEANPDAVKYYVYKSGVLQGETTETAFRVEGLTAKTNRTITVKAVVVRTDDVTGESEELIGIGASVKVKPIS